MSDYTPLTPQEIYQKSLADAHGEPLTPETRIEYFLNQIAEGQGGGGGSGSGENVLTIGMTVLESNNVKTYTLSATYSQIISAISSGKSVNVCWVDETDPDITEYHCSVVETAYSYDGSYSVSLPYGGGMSFTSTSEDGELKFVY